MLVSLKILVGLTLAILISCDPITSVQGRVVQSPGNANEKAPVADATVNVKCDGLKPDEGMTTKTDANGNFNLATAGGTLPDSCTVSVTPNGTPNPIVTTIGASKAQGDDPKNRVRQVEVAVPPK